MSDTAYPNILIINPDGTISAQLSGNLQIPAEPPPIDASDFFDPAHAVEWRLGGGRVAQIAGVQEASFLNEFIAAAISPNGRRLTQLEFQAANPGAGQGGLFANSWLDGSLDEQITILADSGVASFPRLKGVQKVLETGRLQSGQTSILAPGSKQQVTLNHNLGTTNIVVVGQLFDDIFNNASAGSWASITTGQTINSVVIEIQNVGGAALAAHWAGFVRGYF